MRHLYDRKPAFNSRLLAEQIDSRSPGARSQVAPVFDLTAGSAFHVETQSETEGFNVSENSHGFLSADKRSDRYGSEEHLEEVVRSLVKFKQYILATQRIMNHYHFDGVEYDIEVDENAGEGVTAYVGGKIGPGQKQTLKITPQLFDDDFATIVSSLGHEYQHVILKSRENPVYSEVEQEFLAYTWEIFKNSGPKIDSKYEAKCVILTQEFYHKMNRKNKEKYRGTKSKLDYKMSIIKKKWPKAVIEKVRKTLWETYKDVQHEKEDTTSGEDYSYFEEDAEPSEHVSSYLEEDAEPREDVSSYFEENAEPSEENIDLSEGSPHLPTYTEFRLPYGTHI